jgi:hypothetical protein
MLVKGANLAARSADASARVLPPLSACDAGAHPHGERARAAC